MSMDDRPNASIWGTILSITEIALNVYQITAEKGKGLIIAEDEAKKVLSDKVIAKGEAADGFVHYKENSPGERAAANELIKNGHITDQDVIKQYETPAVFLADGRTLNPDYLSPLPEPGRYPVNWGALKETTPIDNGVYFIAGEKGGGIAIHEDVAVLVLSEYAFMHLNQSKGNYLFYDFNDAAPIAVFELSRSHPKVLDLITSWESLMHTLATELTSYSDRWNYISEPDNYILDMPAPSNMFLQRQLDEAAAEPPAETEPDEEDMFFEAPDFFEQEP